MLDNISIILARPIYPVNIGSVARVCTNFGVKNLILISPKCRIDVSEARKFATIRGQDILLKARIENNLADVVSGMQVVVGFTTRVGNERVPTVGVGKMAQFLQAGAAVSLLFGSEDNGLDASELALCTHICQIPTSTVGTSINLSHSVAIALARLYEDVSGLVPEKRFLANLATNSELTMLVKKLNLALKFGEQFSSRVERMIKKANLTSSEVRLVYFLLGGSKLTKFAKSAENNEENILTGEHQ